MLAAGEPVAGGAGLDDVGAVGDAVDDSGCEAFVGEGFGPFNWNWHTLDRSSCGVRAGLMGVLRVRVGVRASEGRRVHY